LTYFPLPYGRAFSLEKAFVVFFLLTFLRTPHFVDFSLVYLAGLVV
jgi:hypothetical protein